MQTQDHMVLLSVAIRASVEAGKSILQIYDTEFDVQVKENRTPLTLADKCSHAIVTKHLQGTGIPILSEEGKDIPYEEREEWNLLWIVDPLDGTKEFIKRNGEFTVNIALVEAGKPVLGVIFLPAMNILYFGCQGLGSFKLDAGETNASLAVMTTEEIMARSLCLPLSPLLPPVFKRNQTVEASGFLPLVIVGSRSHSTPELTAFVEEKRKEYGEVTLISAGSSLKFCLVAEGKADIYPRPGPTMEWDTAAGQAIAENAGRKVLIWGKKDPLRYNRQHLLNPWFVVL